jgi:demethylmenaquinone methyltransferase/2-methoxy-6-polyprenyl-1,4-benzoquinol methylase|tara:strand:- start:536 stop:1240 length:705 start_codon:yes stop_codon:yes gene_type:complete
MNLNNQKKNSIVNKVFDTVNEKYDLMNDLMSFGVHRQWKKNLIEWMGPSKNDTLIDVASGTGDVANLFSNKLNDQCSVECVEPNINMLKIGKKKLAYKKNINWHNNYAEKLPFKSNTFDYYSVSFGIRNTSNIRKSLEEAYRVLKPGGKFFCLEFSKVENEIINLLYKNYSKLIPSLGKIVVGDDRPYRYLTESIRKFYSQDEFVEIMEKSGFHNVEYRNLNSGIAAIHRGWKT